MRERRICILLTIFLILCFINLFFENNTIVINNNVNELYNDERNPFLASPPLKYEWIYNWDSGIDDYVGNFDIDSNQNLYICGNNYLVKFNSSGVELWNKTIPDINYAKDIILDSNEDILIIGKNSASLDSKLLKYNSLGDLQWSQTLQSRHIGGFDLNLAVDSLNNIIVGSEIQNVGAGYSDVYLAKYDSSGGFIWENWWGTSIFEFCYDITIDTSGNIYLAGFNLIIGTNTKNFIIVKFNNLGDYIWDREWNRNTLDECYAIELDSSENIWLGGYTRITSSNHDFVLLKYDGSGSLLLEKIWGGNNDQKCYALEIDSEDNIYLSGNYLVRFAQDGTYKWDISFTNIDLIESKDIILDNFRNLYLFGTSSGSTLDMCLAKANLLPQIAVNSPSHYQLFGNTTIEFNITIDEPFLNSTWYCLNSGQNHTFSGTTGLINQTAWDLCGNGTVVIRFYANNTWSHEGYHEIIVRKDNTNPNISILSPEPNQLFGNATFGFNLSFLEPNLDKTWYSLNGGKNYIFSGSIGTIDQAAWDICGNGTVIIKFYANDTVGNIGSEEIVVRKDQSLPELIINSPTPFQLFGNETISFELFLNKPYLDSTWYSLNNGKNYTFSGSSGTIDQVAWDTCGNGTVTITFYANDTFGEIVSEEVIVRKDTHSPFITIYNPTSYQLFSTASPNFQISIEETSLNTTWYTLDSIPQKFIFTGNSGTINQTAWDSLGSGTILIIFYANNSIGNIGYKEIIVEKDITAPIIDINSPISYQVFGFGAPSFFLTIVEPNLNSTWYTISGFAEKFFFSTLSGKINQFAWDSFGNGTVSITYYANDSFGYQNSESITIRKDIIDPEIIILTPKPNQLFGISAPSFKLSISEPNLDKTWYSVNNGLNYSFTGTTDIIIQAEWDLYGDGVLLLTFYANDTGGNLASKSIIVRKDHTYVQYTLSTPISIDDSNPSMNWTKTTNDYPWCSGSGTWSDPYLIRGVVMDLSGSYNCILIQNSQVYFKIQDCFLSGGSGSSSNGGIKLINVDNGLIIWNDCSENTNGIILQSDSDNNTIFENVCNDNYWHGIFVEQNCDDNNITNNDGKNNYNGLFMRGTCIGNRIISNNFSNNTYYSNILYSTGHGIYISNNCNESIILQNIICYNTFEGIIVGTNCYNSEISYNNISFNGYGIEMGGWSENSMIYKNEINQNRLGGIILEACPRVDVIYNHILKNGGTGIKIWSGSSYCTIKDNLIIDNINYGIDMGESVACNYNYIYNNTLINNGQNAREFDHTQGSKWHYGGLGNYWDDYLGVDADDDGIGDSPYEIPGFPTGPGPLDLYPIWDDGDDMSPIIFINSPTPNQIFGKDSPSFEINVVDPNINSTWYTILGTTHYYIFEGTIGKIDQDLWNSLNDGPLIIRFYANDSVGHVSFDEVNIRKDTLSPLITINSPKMNQLFGSSPPSFNIFVNETHLDKTWYTFDNGVTNVTFIGNGTFSPTLWENLGNGTVTIKFYANDSAGNIGMSMITIRKDIIPPEITIISPQNNGLFGNKAPEFEVFFNEPNLNTTWYVLDGKSYIFTQNGTIDQFAWASYANGTVMIIFYGNDSVGNIAYEQIILQKDILGPIIDIIEPIENQYYTLSAPQFHFSIIDSNLDSIWYTLDDGIINITCYDLQGIINQSEWDKRDEGIVFLKVYANDTLGNLELIESIIYKDTSAPIITINSPSSNQLYGIQAPTFNINIDELNLQEIWYSLNGGDNITFTTENQFDQIEWDKIGNGTVLITFYAIDKAGNINSSVVFVRKDSYMPEITIHSPIENEIFGNTPPNFNISIIEADFVSTWYKIEGITTEFTITEFIGLIDQDAWNEVLEGEITITFYAQDRAGNIGIENVVVIKSIPSPPAISGYNLFWLIGAISVVSVIVIRKLKQ